MTVDTRVIDITARAREMLANPMAVCAAGESADLGDWLEALAEIHLPGVSWHVERPGDGEPYLVIDEG